MVRHGSVILCTARQRNLSQRAPGLKHHRDWTSRSRLKMLGRESGSAGLTWNEAAATIALS